ncbi:MAG: alpha/beta hydrolase [Myxococcales bacterium]|nr:alpha/beta hydrolase [Myxococcales bacterium]
MRAMLVLGLPFFLVTACAATPPPAHTHGSAPTESAPPGALDPELVTYRYPYPVSYLDVRSQGQTLRMAYLDVAPATAPNGRVALLLHGKNFSAAYWAPTIRTLTAAGFRVIAPDQIGFGKSVKPQAYAYSFEALAENTKALFDHLGIERASVIGHSMGGMLATRFALMYPASTERLVLVNPIGLEDWRKLGVPDAELDDLYRKELGASPDSLRTYMRNAYFGGAWKPEYEALLEIHKGWMLHPGYPLVARNAALTSQMIFTQPVVQDFPRITVPTLLIIGQRDRTAIGKDRATKELAATLGNYPELGRRAAASIPGAKLVEIETAGHLPQVEAFDAYARALLAFVTPS